jgi:hypothetical protein
MGGGVPGGRKNERLINAETRRSGRGAEKRKRKSKDVLAQRRRGAEKKNN